MSGMVYADYNYYTQNYLGTMLNEEDFSRLALRASSFLDYYTRGRAAQNAELEAVKMACCAVAEQQHVIEKARALADHRHGELRCRAAPGHCGALRL